jgi:hypothetical protein
MTFTFTIPIWGLCLLGIAGVILAIVFVGAVILAWNFLQCIKAFHF